MWNRTALLKIQNNISTSVDSWNTVALTLLDLSTAFNTIDHAILHDCLKIWFGVDDSMLIWIDSYLDNGKQKIELEDKFTEAFQLPFGIPQVSVLGPFLFTLYTTPLSHVISSFKATHHLYANDTQINLAIDSRNFDSSMAKLTEYLVSVQEWMNGVKLKLNPDKTEFIIISDKHTRESLIPKFAVKFLQSSIIPAEEVKNLGVTFDSEDIFGSEVSKVCHACYYHLRCLQCIRKFLTFDTAVVLGNAIVSSQLDYCNPLLYGASKGSVAKPQKVQNELCCFVFKLDDMSHVKPYLASHFIWYSVQIPPSYFQSQ